MARILEGRGALVILTIALLAAGLDHMSSATSSAVPASVVDAPRTARGGSAARASRLEPLQTQPRRPDEQLVRGLVGPSGGAVTLLGHRLAVPAGEVANPTLFTMVVAPGTAVRVELTAIDVASGLDVGARGFRNPVRLTLSYEGAAGIDPRRLVMGRVENDGSTTPIPSTVDLERGAVWSDVRETARYGLFTR